MGTRCSIAVEKADKSVHVIQCQYDGYLDGVGETLLCFHSAQDQAERLVGLGDLAGITYDKADSYHKRGDPWDSCKPIVYSNLGDYYARIESDVYDNGFRYLFFDGEWHACGRYDGLSECPSPLRQALEAYKKNRKK